MISFSSLSFEGSLQTGSLLSSFFGADIKLRYLEFLEAPCGRAGSRLKVILDFSLPTRTEKSKQWEKNRKGDPGQTARGLGDELIDVATLTLR